MKFLQKIKEILLAMDFFPTNELIRYQGQAKYRTMSGGVISIVIIGIFLLLFLNMGTQTFNREIITSSTTSQNELNPEAVTFRTSPDGGFMFAIAVLGLDLNDPHVKYFNFTMNLNLNIPLMVPINQTYIPLVQCTPAHVNFSQEMLNSYDQLQAHKSLCPPLDYQFTIQGKLTSSLFQKIDIYVTKCNSTIDPTCISDQQLVALEHAFGGHFLFDIVFINTIVNPDDVKYKKYIMEDRNVITFSTTIASSGQAYLQEYNITTDISILPTTQYLIQTGVRMPELMVMRYFPAINNLYASISIRKSSTITTYKRSFNKIDQFCSYIGGLIGTVMMAFFIVQSYNNHSYEIDIGSKLFLDDNNQKIKQDDFNLLYFFGIVAKKVINYVGCKFENKNLDVYIRCQEQVDKQLDICYLIKRISSMERALMKIGILAHKVEKKITFNDAYDLRKTYFEDDDEIKGGGEVENLQIKRNEIIDNKIHNEFESQGQSHSDSVEKSSIRMSFNPLNGYNQSHKIQIKTTTELQNFKAIEVIKTSNRVGFRDKIILERDNK